MEINDWKGLIFAGKQSANCADALAAELSVLGQITKIDANQKSRETDDVISIFDVTELETLLADKKAVVFFGEVPPWTARLDRLLENELKALAYVLDASLHAGISNFIFISDIEGMGAAPRPVTIEENSLWSGQTNANEVQKYWYLCEQECRRAAEEGLNVLIMAAARMEVDPDNPRLHVYNTTCAEMNHAIKKSLLKWPDLQKVFIIQLTASSEPPIVNPVLPPRWMFWKKPSQTNCVFFDTSLTQKWLNQD